MNKRMPGFKNIQQYHTELLQGSITCTDMVTHYLNKTEEQKHLNAFVEVFTAEALLKAKELDNKRQHGAPLKKLHGVVIAIKDVICYKGHKVTAASKILE